MYVVNYFDFVKVIVILIELGSIVKLMLCISFGLLIYLLLCYVSILG